MSEQLGPVAQTFFMDEEISSEFTLDGIVTLVDAAHIDQQLLINVGSIN